MNMAIMITEVYDALKEAGATEEKARRAAETLAGYENRFTAIDRRLDGMKSDFDQRFEQITGKVNLLSWMVGFNLAASLTILFKIFS